jgi:hypothetical protein
MGLKLKFAGGGRFVEFAADTEAVTTGFMNELIDEIGSYIETRQSHYVKILLIVTAPRADLTIQERYQVWQRAFQKGIGQTQIAYVIDGRPIGELAKFEEVIARNRNILLQFFEHRDAALEWLTVSSSGIGRVA